MKLFSSRPNQKVMLNVACATLVFLTLCSKLVAQAPATWTVNPAAFQYSMTLNGVANIYCVESTDPRDKVAAFAGGQCRGVANFSQVLNGRYRAFLIVRSNQTGGETVTFQIYDASTNVVENVVDSVVFQDAATYGIVQSPFELRTNTRPVAANGIAFSIPENAALATTPVTNALVSVTDADLDALTLQFGTTPASNDNAYFTITGNGLQLAQALDFETRPSLTLALRALDARGCAVDFSVTINVQNVNDAPTDIVLSQLLIRENQPTNTAVCQISTIDPEATDTHIYTLVAGTGSTGNSMFNIVGNSLRANQSLDYENANNYSIRLRTTDNAGNTLEKVFSIGVVDANDVSSEIRIAGNLTTVTVSENMSVGTVIGSITTTDQDIADQFVYSFVTGNNSNALFQISNGELRTAAIFDFETTNLYVIEIQSMDLAGSTINRQFVVNIVDANDTPTSIQLSNNAIDENQPLGTLVGNLSATDPDILATFTFSLVSGQGSADNAAFRIVGNRLESNSGFDFETRFVYRIRLRSTDNNGGIYEQAFSVLVSDINDAPTAIACSDRLIAENAGALAAVCNLSTSDADANDTHSYTLVPGFGDNALFSINNNILVANQSFNFEVRSGYSINIQSTDASGASITSVFGITITDANDQPTDISLSTQTVTENQAQGLQVGTFSTTDEDAAQPQTYILTGNAPGNAAFAISGNQLITNSNFDFERQSLYIIEVQSTDAAGAITNKRFNVSVIDANDAPTAIQITDTLVSEALPIATFIAAFSTTDPDANNTFNYTLVNGTGASGNNSFFIRNDSLFSGVVFDFETQNRFSIRVRSTDNGSASTVRVFSINVNNANDAPTAIGLSNVFLNENIAPSTLVGTLSTTDIDNNGPYAYSLVTGQGDADNAKFTIVNDELKTNANINYETASTLSIRVQATDAGGLSFQRTFSIVVNNLNDMPTVLTLSNLNVDENRPINTLIGTLATTDEDVAQAHSYSFASGANNSNSMFLLIGNELRTNASYNFEAQNFYIVYVLSTDAGGATIQQQFVVNILNTNDAPEALFLTGDNVDENLPVGVFVGVLSATDQDVADTKTYALVPGANASGNGFFTVRNDSLFTNSVFDFEQQASHGIRVQVTDGQGAFFVNTFTVNVNDKNDAPTRLNIANNSVVENSPIGTVAGLLSTTDTDANSAFSYTLVSGTGDADNASFRIVGDRLFINVVANYEARATYAVRVRGTDNGGGSLESAFVIDILNTNERPSLASDTIYITENVNLGTVVGTFLASDPDAGDALAFSFVPDAYDALLAVETSGDIVSRGGIDYEQTNLQNAVIINGLPYNGFVRNAVVTDGDGLKDTMQLIFVVRDVVEDVLKANNVVTPNGDGVNDAWELDNPELYKDYEISFYGPNGELMKFVSGDYDNTYTGGDLALQMTVLMRHRVTGQEFTQLVTIIRE